ncbi:MAG TPA: Fe-S cluster assembly protein SufD [Rhizomicrobium sp.]|nr:Fe-S cluster assembly protein SufD [Rhizomicrobium sp.]
MNAALPSLDLRRAEARERFRAKGVPHRRIEEWKYSDLRASLDDEHVAQEGAAQWRVEALPDGVELFDLSAGNAPDWVTRNLGAIDGSGAMAAASFVFAKGGVALRATRAVEGAARLHLSAAGHTRVLIVLEENASLTLMETQSNDAVELRNVGTEIVLASGSKLSHARLAANAPKSIQVETIAVKAAAGASYRAHFANFGAKLSRVDMNIVLEGENAEAHLSGATVLANGHADVTTHIAHAAGNTRSTQLFKNVAGGHSRAIYQGKITVREGANGSDSRQSAKGLLLGERAEIDLKPELEIFADDVKCAHGAAIGDLDVDSLFYLRARGIPDSEARALLIRAFLEDAVAEIENEEIRASVWREVEGALARANEAAP